MRMLVDYSGSGQRSVAISSEYGNKPANTNSDYSRSTCFKVLKFKKKI
jgi:hypothetical protein